MPTLLRDLLGRPVGFLDGERVRDDGGKPLAGRVGSDGQERTLSGLGADWMVGRKVLLDIARGELGIGDVATAAFQADYGIPTSDVVADEVSAVRYVPHDRGVWYPENAADAIQLAETAAPAAGSGFGTIYPGFTSTTFTTTGYAIGAKIPRQLNANADMNLKKRATRRVIEALRLAREVRVATLLTTSTNWASANRVTATAKWNGGATANPLLDMMNALAASYLPANILIMPESSAQYFYVQPQTSTGIRDYIQARGEMPKILYARAKKSLSGAPAYVWAPSNPVAVALVRVTDDPLDYPSSQTFRWLGDARDGARVEGILVREFQDEGLNTWIVGSHNDAEVIVSNQVGAIITGAVQ